MENALRHTDPGTAVEATRRARQRRRSCSSVEDDGPGIPAELRDKVFERFFRGAGDRCGSSGLGLSIVRAVAESHHGTVTLEPPLDGRGARFVVRLPRSCARSRPTRGEHRLTARSSRGAARPIPGCDMSRDVRPAARRLLARRVRSTPSRSAPCTRSSASPSPARSPPRPTGSAASSACAARSSRSSTSPPACGLATERPRARQDRHRRGRHQPGRRDRRRGRGGAHGHVRPARGRPRPPAATSIEAIAKIEDRLVILLNAERPLRAPRGRGPRGGRLTRRAPGAPCSPSASASSSPTTRGLMRRVLADALDRQGFDVVGDRRRRRRGARRLRRASPGRAHARPRACPASTGSACCARCASGSAEPVPVVVVSAFSPAHGARAVDALAEGAFDLVAKPALGEPHRRRSPTSSAARSPTPPAAGAAPAPRRRARRAAAPPAAPPPRARPAGAARARRQASS